MLSALRCPDDGSALTADRGAVRCLACGRRFEVEDGIYRMLPRETAHPDVAAERAQRDREASLYDRLVALRLFSLVETPFTLRPLRLRPQDRVVEVGCGTGRMTVPLVRSGAECICLDHSLASLRILRGKLPSSARVTLVQGDATRLPVRDGWATAALSSQVLEHLPTEELRAALVAELARVLEDGGRLALSAYQRLPLLPHEGRHSGEIFFHRFTRQELRRLLGTHFTLCRLSGRLVYLLVAHAERR